MTIDGGTTTADLGGKATTSSYAKAVVHAIEKEITLPKTH
jgi:riboflavin biosynthesis pyrimidine reductase